MHALTRDNLVSIEFDPWGFSIKGLHTKTVLLWCDSSGELYSLQGSQATPSAISTRSTTALLASHDNVLWHTCLSHPGQAMLQHLLCSIGFSCTKYSRHTCHACHQGKHVRLPFSYSNNVTTFPFQLLHYDVWTSRILRNFGYQYYLVILDDCSHYAWMFLLWHKLDVLPTVISFHAFVSTQI